MANATHMKPRRVKAQVAGRPAVDGAGVHLVRVLGPQTVEAFDPFLMLDAFDSTNPSDYLPGFPMHPHRGIETVTYLAEGRIDHKDSLGNSGTIVSGGCQWMTAGSGILHQEMPQAEPRMLGLQLWVNLGIGDKMAPPQYHDIRPDMIARIKEDGVEVRVLSGRYKGHQGAMQANYVMVTFLDVTLDAGAVWNLETDPLDTVFLYILHGDCGVGPGPENSPINAKHAVLFGPGDTLTLTGGTELSRLVVVSGRPLHQPIAWGGPIVMNTDEELNEAFRELKNGTFIKHGQP